MKKYLAIDYGTKRIGVAINREWLAEPIDIFDRASAIPNIARIIRAEGIEVVCIGIPDGPIADQARVFVKELRPFVEPTILFEEIDETLSSVEAHAKVAQSPMSAKRRRGEVDHYAAATMLQEYLDTHH